MYTFSEFIITFSGVKEIVIVTELNKNPRKVTSWEGIKTDFSLCTINPKSENNCLVISTLAKQSL
jgi:hypothetical protein